MPVRLTLDTVDIGAAVLQLDEELRRKTFGTRVSRRVVAAGSRELLKGLRAVLRGLYTPGVTGTLRRARSTVSRIRRTRGGFHYSIIGDRAGGAEAPYYFRFSDGTADRYTGGRTRTRRGQRQFIARKGASREYRGRIPRRQPSIGELAFARTGGAALRAMQTKFHDSLTTLDLSVASRARVLARARIAV